MACKNAAFTPHLRQKTLPKWEGLSLTWRDSLLYALRKQRGIRLNGIVFGADPALCPVNCSSADIVAEMRLDDRSITYPVLQNSILELRQMCQMPELCQYNAIPGYVVHRPLLSAIIDPLFQQLVHAGGSQSGDGATKDNFCSNCRPVHPDSQDNTQDSYNQGNIRFFVRRSRQ